MIRCSSQLLQRIFKKKLSVSDRWIVRFPLEMIHRCLRNDRSNLIISFEISKYNVDRVRTYVLKAVMPLKGREKKRNKRKIWFVRVVNARLCDLNRHFYYTRIRTMYIYMCIVCVRPIYIYI